MTRHAYPSSAMLGDYMRAAAGFVPATAILAISPVGPVAASILASCAALFALFGVRTALRHATKIEATETTVSAAGPLRLTIRWADLDRVKLAYYSTRRDRRDGWMQLELRGGGRSIVVDSRIEGFNRLAERSALAAAACGVDLSAATAANFDALGVRAPAIFGAAHLADGRA
jgi:hypothetical protein